MSVSSVCHRRRSRTLSESEIYTPLDRKVSRSTRYAFGLGQVAEGLKNFGFNLFVLFYYNPYSDSPGACVASRSRSRS